MRGSCGWDDAVPGAGPVRCALDPAGLIRPAPLGVFTCAPDPVKPRVKPDDAPTHAASPTGCTPSVSHLGRPLHPLTPAALPLPAPESTGGKVAWR